jgi:exodeoxyribonuclease-5
MESAAHHTEARVFRLEEARTRGFSAYVEGLNPDQTSAFLSIMERIKRGERITKLVGYAGTGKTFLLARIAKCLSDQGFLVTVAAPTHKAVGVIQEKLGAVPGIQVSTIHSLLGLRLERDFSNDTGGRVLKGDKKAEITGVVICDEGSMVGTILMDHIRRQERVRWLFVGDNAQLPPVGEDTSALLEEPDATLSTVVRQKGDSQILDLATEIRSGNRMALKTVPTGRDVLRARDADELFHRAYDRFASSEYRDDCGHARMLVFRNRTRTEINTKMRDLLIGSPLPFTPGEWLVMYEPFKSPGETQGDALRCFTVSEAVARMKKLNELAERARYHAEKTGSKSLWHDFFHYRDEQQFVQLHTSQELRVEAVYEDVAEIEGAEWFPRLELYSLTLRSGDRLIRSIPVVKPHERMRLTATLAVLRAEAIKQASLRDTYGKDSTLGIAADLARQAAWQRFYLLDEMFAQVDYAYAMTTHKSQGSTFDHAFIDIPDLMASPQNMRQRLLYTACTRPSQTLTFYF